MNQEVLKLGLRLLQGGVEKNIFYLLNMTEENRLEAVVAKATFEQWCEDNPVEFKFLDENFVG